MLELRHAAACLCDMVPAARLSCHRMAVLNAICDEIRPLVQPYVKSCDGPVRPHLVLVSKERFERLVLLHDELPDEHGHIPGVMYELSLFGARMWCAPDLAGDAFRFEEIHA